ncbi:hypothetical protein ACB092_02G102600 [Castanea dentata]
MEPSPFLKHLQGCHKGEKVKGNLNLKAYLENFGYLSYNNHSKNHSYTNDDDFDELLETAIKTYILNYHLNATGTLDAKLVSTMMMPHCGVADITNGNPKWPSLTYGFLPSTPTEAMSPVTKVFETWAANTHFRFSRAQDYTNADIKLAPTDGRFHYDADEQWSLGASPGAFDLETIALQEIGHLLGLDLSSLKGVTQGLHRDDIDGIIVLYNF